MSRKVLHVGPALTKGGMGRTIQRLHRNPPTNWDSDIVTTHADGGAMSILLAWIRGKRKFIQKIKEKPDLIHVHTATRLSWYRKRKIILKAVKKNIPIIVHLHSGSFQKFARGWIGKDITRILSLDGVHPIVLSEHWKKWLESMISKKVRIVPNPYREGLVPVLPELRDINMLLMVGRPSPMKGHFLAINAVHQLREEGSDIRLHLVGTSHQDLRHELKGKEGIVVEGWVEDNVLDNLMEKAGFLLMPSEYEGMPLSLLDALATGLPSIVSNACSTFINHGGIVVNERNIQSWKDEIKIQINNQEGWEKMSINSPKDVAGLDSESDKKRWEIIYNEVMEIN